MKNESMTDLEVTVLSTNLRLVPRHLQEKYATFKIFNAKKLFKILSAYPEFDYVCSVKTNMPVTWLIYL
jgi:hypothetical protein